MANEGSWGVASSRWRQKESGGRAPALRDFYDFSLKMAYSQALA